MQSRFFKVILEIVSFSAHRLVAPFSHRSSLTVTELSDYITRRKNQKNLNSQKRYKMLVLVLGYALHSTALTMNGMAKILSINCQATFCSYSQDPHNKHNG